MSIKVKIIKEGYGHKPGQVLELTEFEAGHLMGFKYAVPYIEGREVRPAAPPETRVEHSHEPVEMPAPVEDKKEPASFFKRRGRRKK